MVYSAPPPQVPPTNRLSQHWHLSLHVNLSCRLLLSPCIVSFVRKVHSTRPQRGFPLIPCAITVCLTLISLPEVKWSSIGLEERWRNEQFWVTGGTSAHHVVVLQGLLKVIAGIEISFKLTSKSAGEDEEDVYADLYLVKWTSLFIMPLAIIVANIVAAVIGRSRTLYSVIPQWNKLLGGLFFSFWLLAHTYPFDKGLLGRRGSSHYCLGQDWFPLLFFAVDFN